MREKSLVGLFTIKLTKEGKIDDNDLYKINTRAVKRGHYTVKTVKKKGFWDDVVLDWSCRKKESELGP